MLKKTTGIPPRNEKIRRAQNLNHRVQLKNRCLLSRRQSNQRALKEAVIKLEQPLPKKARIVICCQKINSDQPIKQKENATKCA